jgi:hypothetical protein
MPLSCLRLALQVYFDCKRQDISTAARAVKIRGHFGLDCLGRRVARELRGAIFAAERSR